MYFLNSFEVDSRARQFRDDPIMGPATQTLRNLMEWTNTHSDGWAYWPKPVRAAKRLMELIEIAAKLERESPHGHGIIWDSVRAAYVPIRTFKTRHGADFEIVTMAQLSLFHGER
jgi:hypothetical protein